MSSLLVFGARNLGGAIARHMAAAGWDVAAFAQSEESVRGVERDIPGALGLVGDARREDDVERAFSTTLERFGSIDLVTVAISPSTRGRSFGGGSIADADAEAFAPYLDDLLPALSTTLRIGARFLAEQGSGTYVQITGGSARRGMAGRGPWAAAAFATRGLIQSAASELRDKGVHVALLIVDATIESEKTAGFLEDKPAELSAGMDDVARAVSYLAEQSPRAWTHELQITPSGDRWTP